MPISTLGYEEQKREDGEPSVPGTQSSQLLGNVESFRWTAQLRGLHALIVVVP